MGLLACWPLCFNRVSGLARLYPFLSHKDNETLLNDRPSIAVHIPSAGGRDFRAGRHTMGRGNVQAPPGVLGGLPQQAAVGSLLDPHVSEALSPRTN